MVIGENIFPPFTLSLITFIPILSYSATQVTFQSQTGIGFELDNTQRIVRNIRGADTTTEDPLHIETNALVGTLPLGSENSNGIANNAKPTRIGIGNS